MRHERNTDVLIEGEAMTEEERRRCIILGICGPAGQAASGPLSGRREALQESLDEATAESRTYSDVLLNYVLGLVDEALKMRHSHSLDRDSPERSSL